LHQVILWRGANELEFWISRRARKSGVKPARVDVRRSQMLSGPARLER
jgi:hypothetical protein